MAVFLEHNDGSGSSCVFPDGRLTGYTKAPNTENVGAPENHAFRQVLSLGRGGTLELIKSAARQFIINPLGLGVAFGLLLMVVQYTVIVFCVCYWNVGWPIATNTRGVD